MIPTLNCDLLSTKFHYVAQAQLAIRHPNEALSSAMTAYEQCLADPKHASSASAISTLVLKCKKAKWEARERERLRKRSALLVELEERLESAMRQELVAVEWREAEGDIGKVEAEDERQAIQEEARKKIEELREIFVMADPDNAAVRVGAPARLPVDLSPLPQRSNIVTSAQEVPDYLIDNITFEIMHDRKSTVFRSPLNTI